MTKELTQSNEPVLTEEQIEYFIELWNQNFPNCNLREVQLLPHPYKGICIDFHLKESCCYKKVKHMLDITIRKKCIISVGEMYTYKHEFNKYCSEIRMRITYAIYID